MYWKIFPKNIPIKPRNLNNSKACPLCTVSAEQRGQLCELHKKQPVPLLFFFCDAILIISMNRRQLL